MGDWVEQQGTWAELGSSKASLCGWMLVSVESEVSRALGWGWDLVPRPRGPW